MTARRSTPSGRSVLVLAALALAAAVLATAAQGAGRAESAAAVRAADVPRPHIVWKPIPFGAARRAQTAAYAKRHYGLDTWRLVRPRVIVEHYTVSTTMSSAWYTFASDAPDQELHEKPGTCAHFIVDTDGRIYQLVPLTTICRHTVGLNYTSIGIEHVGMSDAQVLGNRRERQASLRLTLWLMQRFGIRLRNVIGHAESLSSPYHRERYPAWRCQTHGDFLHDAMVTYRKKLARRAARYELAVGRPAPWHPTPCP